VDKIRKENEKFAAAALELSENFLMSRNFLRALGMDVATSSSPQYSFRFAFERRHAENIHLASCISTVLQAAAIA
jgi:hypothetical protein